MLGNQQGLAKRSVMYLVAGFVIIALGTFIITHYLNNAKVPVASTSIPSVQAGPVGNSEPSSSDCGSTPPLMLNINGHAVQTCSQPVDGSVTAITASSITVLPSSGSAEVFSISSSTEITHKGQKLTANDIKVGDTVSVIANTSVATQAQYILVNPTFQGAQ